MHVEKGSPRLDMVAMGVSAICAVHCLGLPLAAALLPVAGVWAEAEWVHWAFFLIAAPVSAIALARRGVAPVLRLIGGAGVVLLFAGAMEFPSHDWSTIVTMSGAALLAWAHINNFIKGHRHARLPTHRG